MEYNWYTIYFANLDTQVLASKQVLARDGYSARRNFIRSLRRWLAEPGERYRVDVRPGQQSLDKFPSWMSDPARAYQTAR